MKTLLVVTAFTLALLGSHASQAQVVADSIQLRRQMQEQRTADAKATLVTQKQQSAATRSSVNDSKSQLRDQKNAMREQQRQMKIQKMDLKRQRTDAKEASRQESEAKKALRDEKRRARDAKKAGNV